MAPREQPAVVAVAADAAERAALAEALGPGFAVRTQTPAALRAGPHVDPLAVVALVREPADAEALVALRRAAAPLALVVVAPAGDDDALAALLEAVQPVAWLPDPPPPPALRRALRQAHATLPGGRGARRDHRSAAALLGTSRAIRAVIDEVRRLAPTPLPVLVLGETGTGKELVARAIHAQSPRAGGPFVAVNCSALPDTLLESELFGYERGAFTGAERAKPGLFSQAHRGTLFLDEIGDTSPTLQAKLLRVLEDHRVRPLGGEREEPVDVRIVSATHRDLEELAGAGGFRRDLLFRLNAATVRVPPLRRRRVDIPFLAQHFAEELGAAEARGITLGEDFLDALARHPFPGNVRELRNAVERAIALAEPGSEVSAELLHLGAPPPGAEPEAAVGSGTLRERVDHLELAAIREALRSHAGNRTRVAEALGLSRHGLRQKMRRLGIEDGAD